MIPNRSVFFLRHEEFEDNVPMVNQFNKAFDARLLTVNKLFVAELGFGLETVRLLFSMHLS